MKKIIFFTGVLLMFAYGFAQTNFQWEKIDSISKAKAQIYSDTKMFIAEAWKSAQNVIQNDDKEAGMILVKGSSSQTLFFQMNSHTWTFSYTVSFFMKEKKYRIVINNVYCSSARCQQYEWPHIPCSDTYPGWGKTSLKEDKYTVLMTTLKTELQNIVDSYEKYIKVPSKSNEDW